MGAIRTKKTHIGTVFKVDGRVHFQESKVHASGNCTEESDAFHERAVSRGSMFQERVKAESPTLSLRDRITAAIIREEAAESLLPGIQDDAELTALVHVLNSYTAQWLLKHLSWVGADPSTYWRAQLGERIKAATRGKRSLSQRKKFPWTFLGWFPARVRYELCDLDLDPF